MVDNCQFPSPLWKVAVLSRSSQLLCLTWTWRQLPAFTVWALPRSHVRARQFLPPGFLHSWRRCRQGVQNRAAVEHARLAIGNRAREYGFHPSQIGKLGAHRSEIGLGNLMRLAAGIGLSAI